MDEYVKAFDEEFIKRTQSIIEQADSLKYSFTLLLNCTLALVCLPIERSQRSGDANATIYSDLISKLSDELGARNVISETISPTPPLQKLKCLRNGIAHVAMGAVNEKGTLSEFSIVGSTTHRKTTYSCSFHFNKDQLQKFALFMSSKYLEISTAV